MLGVVERAHAALTRIMKLNSKQTFTKRHSNLNLATFIHNTSYHTSIRWATTVVFYGRDPLKPLDIRFYSNCIQKSAFVYDFVESLRDKMPKRFQTTKEPRQIFQQMQKVLRPKSRGRSPYILLNIERPTHRALSFQGETDPKLAWSIEGGESFNRL